MVANYVAGLRQPISVHRIESFRPPSGTDLDMLSNYVWNLELSEALYPRLQATELGLRNTIHAAASAHYGTEFWFDRRDVLLAGQARSIARARERLTEAKRPHTAGRIVAALHFGFWTSLFYRPYERQMGRHPTERLSWHDANNRPILLLVAFPHLPNRYRSRGPVATRYEAIRELRNRVAHHEPIWNRPDLEREHGLILDAIGWISSQMRDVLTLSDRFGDLSRGGKPGVEAKLRRHLGMA